MKEVITAIPVRIVKKRIRGLTPKGHDIIKTAKHKLMSGLKKKKKKSGTKIV